MKREEAGTCTTVHGCFVQWEGVGILLAGESGVGKTTCALEISKRGGAWIADDIVVLNRLTDRAISGQAHEKIRNLIHLRGQGIIDVRSLPTISIAGETRVDIVIELTKKLEKLKKKGLTAERVLGMTQAEIPCVHVKVSTDTARTVDDILSRVRLDTGGETLKTACCRKGERKCFANPSP